MKVRNTRRGQNCIYIAEKQFIEEMIYDEVIENNISGEEVLKEIIKTNFDNDIDFFPHSLSKNKFEFFVVG